MAWAAPFLKSHPMKYRGVPYKIDQAIDVHTCWRWSFVMNDRRQSGQTKIGHRAAEIQARSAIDKELRSRPDRGATVGNLIAPITGKI
jgi:hypothetical protein